MADKSFAELVSDAPEAAGAGTISLVGVLGRSKDPKKFVLTLANGRTVTLDIDAVHNHQVLSGAAGQTVVSVGLDASRVPQEAVLFSVPYLPKVHTDPPPWQGGLTPPQTLPLIDVNTLPSIDVHTGWPDPSPPPSPPFSLAVPQAFQAMMAPQTGWWNQAKVLTDAWFPFGPLRTM